MGHGYQYSNRPRNILRFALATWRLTNDPDNTYEASIVELTFNRSCWGRKVARWDEVAEELVAQYPSVTHAMKRRQRLPRLELQKLAKLPAGSLGRTLASVEIRRGYDPNLVEPLPDTTDGDWLLAHLYETHDAWHVLTGFNFDLEGEMGVAGVYMAQMPNNTFVAFMMSIGLLKFAWKDAAQLGGLMRAFVDGYQLGSMASPLVGLDWARMWGRDLDELRRELNIDEAGRLTLAA